MSLKNVMVAQSGGPTVAINASLAGVIRGVMASDQYETLVDYAIEIGIENGFIQEGDTAEESFIPAFDCEGV